MKKYVVGVLMERIVFDIMGLLLEIEKRDCYILVIVDYFIKWIEVVFLLDQEVVIFVLVFIDRFIGVFGILKEIYLD